MQASEERKICSSFKIFNFQSGNFVTTEISSTAKECIITARTLHSWDAAFLTRWTTRRTCFKRVICMRNGIWTSAKLSTIISIGTCTTLKGYVSAVKIRSRCDKRRTHWIKFQNIVPRYGPWRGAAKFTTPFLSCNSRINESVPLNLRYKKYELRRNATWLSMNYLSLSQGNLNRDTCHLK